MGGELHPFVQRIDNWLNSQNPKKSRSSLARDASIPEGTIKGWFNRQSLPNIDHAKKIADAMGVTVDYLLTGEEIISQQDDPLYRGICKHLKEFSYRQLVKIEGMLLALRYQTLEEQKEIEAGDARHVASG